MNSTGVPEEISKETMTEDIPQITDVPDQNTRIPTTYKAKTETATMRGNLLHLHREEVVLEAGLQEPQTEATSAIFRTEANHGTKITLKTAATKAAN